MMSDAPDWLTMVAWISLTLGVGSAVIIVADLSAGRRQHMWVMNVVWTLTALYSGVLGLIAYFKIGRLSSEQAVKEARRRGIERPAKRKPFWQVAAVGTTHCGAGCTLGDLVSEGFVVLVPITLFGEHIFGTWVLDFVLAFAFGIAFQYFTIQPMRGLSVGDGMKAALKADAASLTAWQLGMYGWMAIATFLIFGYELPKSTPVFWFVMQIAMLFGFLTSFPINWWLIHIGAKEAM